MKFWKTLLFSLCVTLGLSAFLGIGAVTFTASAETEPTYISVKGGTFWDTDSTGGDFYYVFIEFTDTCNGTVSPDPNTLKDNFIINGKTMSEINAHQPNSVILKGWNQGTGETKLWLQISSTLSGDYGFKKDGTDTIIINEGMVVRNGYVVKEEYKAQLKNGKFYRIGVQTKVIDLGFYDTNSTGSDDYYYIFVGFDSTPYGIDPTDPHTFLDDCLINGVSLRELNSVKSGAISVLSWEQGGAAKNKLMLMVLTDIGNGYGLKRDNTDVVTVKKGAVVRNGNFVSEEYNALLHGTTFYKQYPKTETLLSFNTASLYRDVQTGWDWLYLIFDSAITDEIAVTGLTANILTDIKINNQTVSDYNATATSKINAVWGETEGNIAKLRLMIPSTLEIERLQVAKGFATMNGKTLDKEVDRYHYTANGKDTFIGYTEPNGTNTELDYISVYPNNDGTNDWIFYNFTSDIVTESSRDFTKYVYDYIKINDKTIGEITKLDSDAVSVEFPTGTNKKQLLLRVRRDSEYGVSATKTHTFEVLQGFTGLNGASTTIGVKKLYYNKNSFNKVLPYVKPSGQVVGFNYMSMYLNMDSGANHMVFMNFDGEITDASSREVYSEYVYDYIEINGKTIAEILQLNPGVISIEYPTKTQFLLRLKTDKLKNDTVIKFDGTDVYTIKSGFTGLNGASVDKDYSYTYYNKNGANKFIPAVPLNGQTVNVTSVEIYPQNLGENMDWMYFCFDGDIAAAYDNTETTFIYDYIRINGVTLGEINAKNENNVMIIWRPDKANKILVKLKIGLDESLSFDGADRIEVLAGFVGTSGAITTQKYDKVYYNAKMVDTDTVANIYEIISVTDGAETVGVKLKFLLAYMIDGSDADLSKITFNGRNLSDINGSTAVWNTIDGKSILNVTLPKSAFSDQNYLKLLSGFSIWDDIALNSDIELKYSQKYSYWYEDTGFVFPDEKIEVNSVGAPRILANGDFALPLTFSKTLTNTRLQNFTDAFTTLLQKSGDGEVGYYYDAELIGYLIMTDLPARALEYIKVNGVALKDYDAVSVSMFGTEIMIVISASDSAAIKNTSQNITVEINEGFRSMLGGVTEKDVKYTYDYAQNTWVYGDYVTTAPEKSDGGCGSVFTGSELIWIVLIVIPMVIKKCKKRYGER